MRYYWILLTAPLLSARAAAAQAPTMATQVQGLPISFDECKSRVSQAMEAEGYSGFRDFGNGWIGSSATRTVAVGCVRGSGETVLFVNTAGEDETNARDRLVARIRGSGGGPPAGRGGTIAKSPNSAFCLNLHNHENRDGAVVNLWSCNGHPSQQWRVGGDGTIRSAAYPDRCLNLHNHENRDGAVVNLWSCNGHPSQQWRVSPDLTIRQAAFPDKCLNLHFNAHQDGGVVNLWSCNGHESQRWGVSR